MSFQIRLQNSKYLNNFYGKTGINYESNAFITLSFSKIYFNFHSLVTHDYLFNVNL